MEMREIGLRSFVHVKNERLAAEVLIKGVHPVEGVGLVDEEGRGLGIGGTRGTARGMPLARQSGRGRRLDIPLGVWKVVGAQR